MLNDNIKALRMAKGLSQEELASRIHVVRQTISKWEKGIAVPGAEALTQLAEALETTVPTLLGEALPEPEAPAETLEVLAEKLAQLNDAYIRQQRTRRRIIRGLCIAALVLVLLIEVAAALWGWHTNRELSSAIGVIGGADGPPHRITAYKTGLPPLQEAVPRFIWFSAPSPCQGCPAPVPFWCGGGTRSCHRG